MVSPRDDVPTQAEASDDGAVQIGRQRLLSEATRRECAGEIVFLFPGENGPAAGMSEDFPCGVAVAHLDSVADYLPSKAEGTGVADCGGGIDDGEAEPRLEDGRVSTWGELPVRADHRVGEWGAAHLGVLAGEHGQATGDGLLPGVAGPGGAQDAQGFGGVAGDGVSDHGDLAAVEHAVADAVEALQVGQGLLPVAG